MKLHTPQNPECLELLAELVNGHFAGKSNLPGPEWWQLALAFIAERGLASDDALLSLTPEEDLT